MEIKRFLLLIGLALLCILTPFLFLSCRKNDGTASQSIESSMSSTVTITTQLTNSTELFSSFTKNQVTETQPTESEVPSTVSTVSQLRNNSDQVPYY
jgi:uncharacterized protein YpmS